MPEPAPELTLFPIPGEIVVTAVDDDRWQVSIGGWSMFLGRTLFPTEKSAHAFGAAVAAVGREANRG
ncbi:hypothetical protein [Nocardia farcinica]